MDFVIRANSHFSSQNIWCDIRASIEIFKHMILNYIHIFGIVCPRDSTYGHNDTDFQYSTQSYCWCVELKW